MAHWVFLIDILDEYTQAEIALSSWYSSMLADTRAIG